MARDPQIVKREADEWRDKAHATFREMSIEGLDACIKRWRSSTTPNIELLLFMSEGEVRTRMAWRVKEVGNSVRSLRKDREFLELYAILSPELKSRSLKDLIRYCLPLNPGGSGDPPPVSYKGKWKPTVYRDLNATVREG